MGDSAPVLVLYKELTEADLRKLEAESNDTPSGGGARDLRLPDKAFGHVMRRLLPKSRTESRSKKLGGTAEVHYGPITYFDDEGESRTAELTYWPPTAARPSEGRIAKVHASPALGGRLPEDDKGRIFLMFIKWSAGMVQVVYAYEKDLRGGEWADGVSSPILRCVADSDQNGKSVQGYIDLSQGEEYCHGA